MRRDSVCLPSSSSQLGIPPPEEGELEAPFLDADAPIPGQSRRPTTARMSMVHAMRAELHSTSVRVRIWFPKHSQTDVAVLCRLVHGRIGSTYC